MSWERRKTVRKRKRRGISMSSIDRLSKLTPTKRRLKEEKERRTRLRNELQSEFSCLRLRDTAKQNHLRAFVSNKELFLQRLELHERYKTKKKKVKPKTRTRSRSLIHGQNSIHTSKFQRMKDYDSQYLQVKNKTKVRSFIYKKNKIIDRIEEGRRIIMQNDEPTTPKSRIGQEYRDTIIAINENDGTVLGREKEEMNSTHDFVSLEMEMEMEPTTPKSRKYKPLKKKWESPFKKKKEMKKRQLLELRKRQIAYKRTSNKNISYRLPKKRKSKTKRRKSYNSMKKKKQQLMVEHTKEPELDSTDSNNELNNKKEKISTVLLELMNKNERIEKDEKQEVDQMASLLVSPVKTKKNTTDINEDEISFSKEEEQEGDKETDNTEASDYNLLNLDELTDFSKDEEQEIMRSSEEDSMFSEELLNNSGFLPEQSEDEIQIISVDYEESF